MVRKNHQGNNVLHVASNKGNIEALAYLLNKLSTDKAEIKDAFIKAANGNGYTPLDCASIGCHDHCVALLLHYGADVTSFNENGYTSIMLAARWNAAHCLVALTKSAGCCVLHLKHSRTGNTALHMAVQHNAFDAVKVRYSMGCKAC